MIDLHCHILPGIDDGAVDIREALAMADLAARDGIRTIVATPHTERGECLAARVRQHVAEINIQLKKHKIPVTILAGAEIAQHHFHSRLAACTLADTDYILLELPSDFSPITVAQDLFALLELGLRPIIAHPERNRTVISRPDVLFDILSHGIFVQLNAGSLTGEFGPTVRECAMYLLRREAVHFIASDAHSASFRKPELSLAVHKASRLIGRQRLWQWSR